jgi:carotenoid cleavage dioxygenase-like enzyme
VNSNKTMKYKLPRQLLRTRRENIADLNLAIFEGSLPKDLTGYTWFMLPAGDCEDGKETIAKAPVLGGDGIILKVDFTEPGQAVYTQQFAVSESFLVDEATWNKHTDRPGEGIDKSGSNPYHKWRFIDFGLGRMNFKLGMRNRMNTAITPFQFAGDEHARLLMCADDGRPYECDPKTLKARTPIGNLDQWGAIMGNGYKLFGKTFAQQPFPLIMATAHPVFDPKTKEVFTVNYGRTFGDTIVNAFVWNSRIESIADVLRFLFIELPKYVLLLPVALILFVVNWLMDLIKGRSRKRYTHLIRWYGKKEFEKFNLVTPDDKPIVIKQTLHQIAVTENHILLMDASFKFTVDQMMSAIRPFGRKGGIISGLIERIFRSLVSAPMEPDTHYYLLNRKDLDSTPNYKDQKDSKRLRASQEGTTHTIRVKPVTLPFETLHFITDYKEEEGKITAHLAHNNAACLAEWIRSYDKQFTGDKYNFFQLLTGIGMKPSPAELLGMVAVGQMDVSRIEKVVIDTTTGNASQTHSMMSLGNMDGSPVETVANTFNLSFYAYRDQSPIDALPEKIDHIYWMCSGLYPEALTYFIYRLYKNYEYRVIDLEEFEPIALNGKPSNLIRVNCQTMNIDDQYIFSPDEVGMSPIFIPRKTRSKSVSPQQDGYILCTVYSNESQYQNDIHCAFWLFDAANLAQGPVCKMGHENAIFGMTLHTAYTAEAQSPSPNNYRVDVEHELQQRIAPKNNELLSELFEKHVYPYYKTSS